jgi:hypothetical protein
MNSASIFPKICLMSDFLVRLLQINSPYNNCEMLGSIV